MVAVRLRFGGESGQLRQFLLQLLHGFEKVSHLFYAHQDVLGLKNQARRVFLS